MKKRNCNGANLDTPKNTAWSPGRRLSPSGDDDLFSNEVTQRVLLRKTDCPDLAAQRHGLVKFNLENDRYGLVGKITVILATSSVAKKAQKLVKL